MNGGSEEDGIGRGASLGCELIARLRELVFGEHLDVPPGRWLVWHGRGPLGPTRYACGITVASWQSCAR